MDGYLLRRDALAPRTGTTAATNLGEVGPGHRWLVSRSWHAASDKISGTNPR